MRVRSMLASAVNPRRELTTIVAATEPRPIARKSPSARRRPTAGKPEGRRDASADSTRPASHWLMRSFTMQIPLACDFRLQAEHP